MQVNKALYGLKEAPRLWYEHIDEFLLSVGFRKSDNDPNPYLTPDWELVLLLYVDDLLLIAKHHERIDQVKDVLYSRYLMSDLGQARGLLGLQIDQLPNGQLKLHQTQFILKVLKQINMQDCNGVHTPKEAGRRLVPAKGDDKLVGQREYQSLVGSLMYIAVGTRPDLAFTVLVLSKFNAKPMMDHFLATKRVLRYLKETVGMGLVYRSVDNLTGYTDSDFARYLNKRKSTSGYVFTRAGAALSWKSKKQSLVSLPSTEAEYVPWPEVIRKGIWLERLYHDITTSIANTILPSIQLFLTNSQEAICLAKTPGFNTCTKYAYVKYH